MPPRFFGCMAVSLALSLSLAAHVAHAADEPAPPVANAPPAQASAAQSSISTEEIKTTFASQCAWCHNDYGMKAGKGPQLAGTKMTEKQVESRIRNGKEDAMPPFKRVLNDPQITAFAKYIKGLKAE